MAQKLMEQGYNNVHPLYGGFEAWRDANAPLEPKEEKSKGQYGGEKP
ncbi:MAG TPA: hypothetical protein VNO70_02990 [Blastocatellia bacterium]|nr:hypothetical protein [Blastocatellia bacterium]